MCPTSPPTAPPSTSAEPPVVDLVDEASGSWGNAVGQASAPAPEGATAPSTTRGAPGLVPGGAAPEERKPIDLKSSDARFGGLSSLRSTGPGQLLSVTDGGHWIALDLVEQGDRLVRREAVLLQPRLQAAVLVPELAA